MRRLRNCAEKKERRKEQAHLSDQISPERDFKPTKNFHGDPREDHIEVIMKYLLEVKYHFTKFTWLRAIKIKEANHVRAELEHLYCEWRFPLIHQIDHLLSISWMINLMD